MLLQNCATVRQIAAICLAGLLSGCAAPPQDISSDKAVAIRIESLLPADLILLGEQHDAPAHQTIERQVVQALALSGRLAALALEMADAGATTQGLPVTATEAQVQTALRWSDQAWPWAAYGPAVMAAVGAGVPVVGANLPRSDMRAAMADTALDGTLRGPAIKAQQQRIREGHCNMLPESQIQPMTRIQIARDIRMGQTLVQQARAAAGAGKAVLLIAGAGHVDRFAGIPQHLEERLAPDLKVKVLVVRSQRSSDATKTGASTGSDAMAADLQWDTPAVPPKDYCAAFGPPGKP